MRGSETCSFVTAWRTLAAALLCLSLAAVALAQEEPAATPEEMPETTMQNAADEQADVYRAQRERESDESSAVVRVREGQEGGAQAGGEYSEDSQLRDAWLDGKLEVAYALNRHLNPFSIDTSVEDGVVSLTGQVGSEVDKDLAAEVARNIEGIEGVRNDLVVKPEGEGADARAAAAAGAADDEGERTFAQRIDDATTTATVKSKLLMDDETEGLEINVDTRDHVVTLSGSVESEAERKLAEQIASNVEEVERVQNELEVVAAAERGQP